MKRFIFLVMAVWVSTFAAFAAEQKVHDVEINLTLIRNGNAVIHEKWDVDTGDQITEWYLPRENLGDIRIEQFTVYSDNEELRDEGEWDVDRSRRQKAGKYGIVHKQNGVELCWGIGEYGHHVFEPLYVMTNAVKSLNDYDMLHLQLVNDELKAPPQHVKVTIRLSDDHGYQLDTTNTRVWGFGFHGTASFENGEVVFESSEPFGYYSSVIVLLRFDKGLFLSQSVQERDFQAVLDRAMEGADFGGEEEEEDTLATIISVLFTVIFGWFLFIKPFLKAFRGGNQAVSKRRKRQILGAAEKDITWSRELPFEGDLLASEYTLKQLGEDRKSNALASAEILRMIYNGYLDVSKDASGKVELRFGNGNGTQLDPVAKGLRSMMKEAAGNDDILQDKEFSAWSKQHTSRINSWVEQVSVAGQKNLSGNHWIEQNNNNKYTEDGQKKARELLGFKKYLQDFTLTGERETVEAHLWQEFLVYGALLGVADKVAKQLKDIDPVIFEKAVGYDYTTFSGALNQLDSLSRAITNANRTSSLSSYSGGGSGGSWGGFGGGTSFGGGGGFSGGGHGGGGR